jgi:uncharacterized membrane protein YbhN (UPF0104 family)
MTQSQRSRWRDPRLALGLAVTALAVWWSFRGVDLRALGAALAGADLRVAAPGSLACYAASLWVRALRWRHLAAAVGELPHGVAYRATAIRFMGNNLFPFRLGEFAGAWFAARDAGGSAAAWFGTIVLERAFDMAAIMSLAVFLVAEHIELPLAVRGIAFVPILGVAALRLWPAPFVTTARGVATALLPAGLAARALALVEHIVAGLSGIRDARGLALVIWHTALQWGVAATLPFYLAQRAFAVSLGSVTEDYIAALKTMVGVGVAVALPQAPGFLGVYHFACREVLSALGVPAATALGVGTLAHALFWLSITGLGLLALRGSRGSLAEAVRSVTAQKAP